MDSSLRKQIIYEFIGDIENLSLTDIKIKLFEKVRDIPYGDIDSRNPKDVYDRNKGTCSGKHELLKELYNEFGIKIKDFIAMHKFNDLKVNYPSEIEEILCRTEILDPHNFFKIYVNNKWIIVDCTWDKSLKKLDFLVNENWDGESDTNLAVNSFKIFEAENPIELKKEMIYKLPEQVQKDRKLFLKKLTEWFDTIRY